MTELVRVRKGRRRRGRRFLLGEDGSPVSVGKVGSPRRARRRESVVGPSRISCLESVVWVGRSGLGNVALEAPTPTHSREGFREVP